MQLALRGRRFSKQEINGIQVHINRVLVLNRFLSGNRPWERATNGLLLLPRLADQFLITWEPSVCENVWADVVRQLLGEQRVGDRQRLTMLVQIWIK